MNQKEKILKYIKQNKQITVKEIIYDLGITQGATRIKELIEDGHPIKREKWKDVVRRDGTETKVRVYEWRPPEGAQGSMFGPRVNAGVLGD